jgi:dolichol kinase
MAETAPGARLATAAARADGGGAAPVAGVRDVTPLGRGGSLRRELRRKRIHLATALVPAAVWFVPRGLSIGLLVAAVATALIVEWARRRHSWVRYRFLRGTRTMLRGHERHRLAGATHMAFGYLLALLIFPRPVAVVAMLYNALGDAAAAIVGRRWGRHRTGWGKSWEGAAAALGINLAVGLLVPGIGTVAAVLGAIGGAALEFLPLPLDDNVRVTLGGGFALWLGTAIG